MHGLGFRLYSFWVALEPGGVKNPKTLNPKRSWVLRHLKSQLGCEQNPVAPAQWGLPPHRLKALPLSILTFQGLGFRVWALPVSIFKL